MRLTAKSYPSLAFLPSWEYFPVIEIAEPRMILSPSTLAAAGPAPSAATSAATPAAHAGRAKMPAAKAGRAKMLLVICRSSRVGRPPLSVHDRLNVVDTMPVPRARPRLLRRRSEAPPGTRCAGLGLSRRAAPLQPGPVVDGVLEGCPRLHQAPAQRPLVGVVEALTRVGLRRCVQNARDLELLGVEQSARLLDQVTGVLARVPVDRLGRARLGAEHRGKRRPVELVPGRFAAGRV